MKRIGYLFLILVVSAVGFYYQPWADLSPATMDSLFNPDKRIQNFRDMEKTYPYKVIKAGDDKHVWPGLDLASEKKPFNTEYEFNGETLQLSDFIERSITTGLIIIKNGEVIHENYRLGETKSTNHTSWSVAKSFVSTLVGMAVDEGLIKSVNDKAEDYLPAFKGTAYGAARIKDLLQMSSGVDFFESYNTSLLKMSDAQKILFRTWVFGEDLGEVLAAYPKFEEPGTRFEYRSSDTHILSLIVAKVMNKPLTEVIEERLWQPLGMESDATWLTDGSEQQTAIGFCCLNATLRDFARLGEFYRLGGMWNGKRLLSQAWINEATTPSDPHVMPGVPYKNRGYQYQWWTPINPDREYAAMGIWGQYVWVDEKAGVVIARTGVDPDFRAHMDETITTMRAIVDAVK